MGRPPSDLPVKIVHAARARFLADGVDGASLRNIARDAHTSIGMIYYYYPTKDELFLAVVEEIYGELLSALSDQLAGETTAEGRVRALFARFAAMTDEELTVVRLVIREMLGSASRRRLLVQRFARGHVPIILSAVQEGLARGELDASVPPPVTGIALLVLGMFPQLIHRLAGDALPLPGGEQLADALARVLLHGVASRDA